MGVDRTIAAFHGCFDFFFQVCEGLALPRSPQVHILLFRTKWLRNGGGKLSDFLGDLSADDVFRVASVQ